MPLIADNFIRRLGGSAMEPIVFRCRIEEGPAERAEWVVKLMGKNSSELIGDWVGCLAARALGIATPDVDIASVSAQALETCPDNIREWAIPGPAFASRYMGDTVEVLNDQQAVDQCDGTFLGALYAVDAWLEVLDRKKPEGTWNLLRRTDESDSQAYAIDFGKSIAECLFPPILGPDAMRAPLYPPIVRQAASVEAALATARAIVQIEDELLDGIVASIPAPWLNGHVGRRECVGEFLRRRRVDVEGVCGHLKAGLP